MRAGIDDVSLENLERVPEEARDSVFWELEADDDRVDPLLHKEEWFSSTLLDWGPCGKLLLEDEKGVAFAQYAPATLFPRLAAFRCGRVSADALYVAYCYVVPGRRGRGLGTDLLRAVARDAGARGYRALEALGERTWQGGWVLPVGFLGANGFAVVRDDADVPLLRLDVQAEPAPQTARSAAAISMPGP